MANSTVRATTDSQSISDLEKKGRAQPRTNIKSQEIRQAHFIESLHTGTEQMLAKVSVGDEGIKEFNVNIVIFVWFVCTFMFCVLLPLRWLWNLIYD